MRSTVESILRETPGTGIERCHVGGDAAHELAEFIRGRGARRVLVVYDENTWQAGGEEVVRELEDARIDVLIKDFGPDPLDASEELANEVLRAGLEVDVFIAVGSGTLCDLVKHAGTHREKPAVLYPTAASMNGYTSGIVALKVRGLKRTLPCTPAAGIFADPAKVATAPQRMLAAGVADFLSKCSASADWRAAHLLRDEYYDQDALRFYEGTIERVLDAAEAAGRGEASAVATVLDALFMSGLSMLVAGSSSPASGGEHLLSHYIDMKQALYGTPNDLHGTQVGVGTVHCLRLWERLIGLQPDTLDIDALVDAQPGPETIEEWVREDWPEPVAAEVLAQWREKALEPAGLRAEIARFRGEFECIREAVRKDLLPADKVSGAIARAGGPTRIEDTLASPEEYRKGLERARFIRNRFTVLDLAAELGI